VVFEELVLPPLEWDPAWGEFSAGEWVMTGTAATTSLVAGLVGPRDGGPVGGWGFDEGVRSTLLPASERGRRTARDASDVLLTLAVSYPMVVDTMIVAAWHRRSPEAARMMGLINLEAMAITLSISTVVKTTVGRDRPYGRTCGETLSETNELCTSRRRYYSFPSGHTSTAFTAAALTCSHHVNLDLYANRTADIAACAVGFGVAAATGTLRIVGDQHYATDVLAGAAIGTATGFLVPWLFHYRHDEETQASTGVDVSLVPMHGLGVGAVGVW
jgi:membrane-associated phospholipid phosphatase